LIGKLNAKVVEGKRKRLELSEQDLFRKNVASVAAKMSPTATYLDPNGLTPKPYVKGDAQAAKTLKNMNKPSTENPTNKFTPALDGSELPKVSMSNLASKKLGQASGTKDGKAQMKGAPQWDANLASPKKPIQNAGGNPYSGAI
jgi:hypothetical protein